MKRITAALLCVCLLCGLLGGCAFPLPGRTEHSAKVITVSGAEIGGDLYAYYLTLILRDGSAYGLPADPDRKSAEEKALRLCEEYVAVNTAFRDEGLRLGAENKKKIAENVSTKWSIYRNYYRTVGITKQTLTQYETCQARREQLVAHLYGTGGARAVAEAAWNASYAVNYVTFKSINGYLTQTDSSGKTTRLPDAKVTEAEDLFRTMSDLVRGGTSIEDVCQANANSPYVLSAEAQTLTINRETSNYPQEFFDSVRKMDEGAVRIIETQDYIFLVVKQSAKSDENLAAHKQACLQELCRDDFDGYLTAMIEGYRAQKNTAAVDDVYASVKRCF